MCVCFLRALPVQTERCSAPYVVSDTGQFVFLVRLEEMMLFANLLLVLDLSLVRINAGK